MRNVMLNYNWSLNRKNTRELLILFNKIRDSISQYFSRRLWPSYRIINEGKVEISL